MDQSGQKAKYPEGTIINVAAAELKADSGTFRITSHFPDQPNGEAYFQWARLGKDGKLLAGRSTTNLRGGRFSWLEQYAAVVK